MNLCTLVMVVTVWIVMGSTCFELNIYHTNDIHARYDERGPREGGECKSEAGSCYGGMARHSTFFKSVRAQEEADHEAGVENNNLILSAGDWFSGTVYYIVNRGNLTAHFLSSLGYDALAYGNHEFDNGPDNLAKAMAQIPADSGVALISANMEVGSTGIPNSNSVIREFVHNNVTTKVGIIGYTTPDTAKISSPGPEVEFKPVVQSVREEAEKLQAQGVKIIVAVGHAGIETDMDICDKVHGVDIVVGGHTNSFLANPGSSETFPGGAKVDETVVGPYPEVRRNGKCLVVQGYAYGKFIGALHSQFNDDGEITGYSGDPILMWGDTWPQDPEVLQFLGPYTAAVADYGDTVLGYTNSDVDGSRIICRFRECGMGNIITDANVWSFRKNDPSTVCGLANSGGIRAGIESGNITYREVLTVLPFSNTIDRVTLTGSILKQALEYSVSSFNATGFNIGAEGRFLQVSGIRANLNLSAEVGSRVRRLQILDSVENKFTDAVDEQEYGCAVPSFLLDGGDGFDMFDGVPRVSGDIDGTVFAEFLKENNPLDDSDSLQDIPSRLLFDHELSGSYAMRGSALALGFVLSFISF